MDELRKAKLYRFIARLCFFLVALVAPALILCLKYKDTMFHGVTKTSVTFYGFVVAFFLFILMWKYKQQLMTWIESWEYSILKYIFIGISRVWIYILICGIIFITKKASATAAQELQTTIDKVYNAIEYCAFTICVCESVAYLIIYPIENKFDYQVKRYIRKQERIEDVREAIK